MLQGARSGGHGLTAVFDGVFLYVLLCLLELICLVFLYAYLSLLWGGGEGGRAGPCTYMPSSLANFPEPDLFFILRCFKKCFEVP